MTGSGFLSRQLWRLGAAAVAALCLGGAGLAQSATLQADKARLLACVEAAFPEGAPPGAPAPPHPRECLDRLESEGVCARGPDCARRESLAWLALAREADGKRGGPRNRAANKAAVEGIVRQARAVCTAAAANSAWGGDQVKTGAFRIDLDHQCMRDAMAGQTIFMLGYAYGA